MHHRILVIDQDQTVASLLSQSINSRIDCEVHTASDRAEAMALMECYTYSLVVTDHSVGQGTLKDLSLKEDPTVTPLHSGLVAYCGQENANTRNPQTDRDASVNPLRLDEIRSAVRAALSDRDFSAQYTERSQSTARLNQFLGAGGTRVYVQPIYRVDCAPPALVAVEFLTHGPAGSLFERPDVLFAYTRAAQTESRFDRHCIQRALAVAAHLPAYVHISVNAHASTLCAPPDFSEWFAEAANAEGIDLRRITLEIIEQSPAWNKNALLHSVESLRSLGVKIALDDIGLGHSNYQLVIDIRPDWLKIDRYFVNRCSKSSTRRAVIRSVSRLAADLGTAVIAEGVESVDDLQELKSQGIYLVQGYLLCPPKSVTDAFASVLAEVGRPCSCTREGGHADENCELRGVGLCLREDGARETLPPYDRRLAMAAGSHNHYRL